MHAASLAVPRPRPVKVASADDWFFALDQQPIGTGPDRRVLQVLGIHRDGGGLWIQLAPDDDPFATIVVRVSAATQLPDVLHALEHRSHGDGRPEVVDLSG